MKKIVLTTSILMFLSLYGFSQIKVNSSGRVGFIGEPSSSYKVRINGNTEMVNELKILGNISDGPTLQVGGSSAYQPTVLINGSSYYNYELYVTGETYSYLGYKSSDLIFKKNVRKIDGPEMLLKLMKVEGKKYEFKDKNELEFISFKDSSMKKPVFPKGEHYGLIAQEIEKEFPELVRFDSLTNTRAINYDGMIPILLESIKELQHRIANLEDNFEILKDCCNYSSNLKRGTLYEDEINTDINNAKLFQNNPNPFSVQTTIRFEIPQTVQSSQLHICNMTGTLLKTITINQRGQGNELINANEFVAGMYLYSLVCDGKIVDTKQMLLTE